MKRNATISILVLLIFISISSYAQSDLATFYINGDDSDNQKTETTYNSNSTPNISQNSLTSDDLFSEKETSYFPNGEWNILVASGFMEDNPIVRGNNGVVTSLQTTEQKLEDFKLDGAPETLSSSNSTLVPNWSNCLGDFYSDDIMSGLIYYCCRSMLPI